MTRCQHTLWDDPSALQCVRTVDPAGASHTHVYEHATHPDRHDTAEEASDPC